MAREFNGTATTGTGEYLEVDATPLTGFPLTVSAWGRPTDTTVFKEVFNISDKDDPNNWLVRLAFTNVATIRVYSRDGATNDGGADTSTNYTANAWHHVAATLNSSGRAVFLNGGGKGTNAVAKTPVGPDRISVGRAGDSTPSDPMAGRIAEVAVWNVELSDAEILLLARGVSPLRIRPASLRLYYPLYGSMSPEPNLAVGGATYNLAITGTPVQADHAPVMSSFGWEEVMAAWAAAGGGGPNNYSQSASGTVSSAGALAKRTNRSTAGNLTPTAAGILKAAAAELTGALASAGALTKRVARALSGSAASAGTLASAKATLVALTGAIASAGALARQTSRAAAGVIASSGVLSKRPARSVAGAIASAGAVTAIKTALIALTGAIASAGALVRRTGKIEAGVLPTAGAVQRGTLRALAGALTTAGALTAVKAALISLAGSISSAGVLARRTLKTTEGQLFSGGGVIRRTARALVGTIAPAGSIVKRTIRSLLGALAAGGAVSGVGGGGIPSLGVFEASSTSSNDDIYETE